MLFQRALWRKLVCTSVRLPPSFPGAHSHRTECMGIGHLHCLSINFPHVDREISAPRSHQVVAVAADRQGANLSGMRDEAHHLVGISVKRHLHLYDREKISSADGEERTDNGRTETVGA